MKKVFLLLIFALHLQADSIVKVQHNSGFFSCCSVKLHYIVKYFNENKALPSYVDSSEQFAWYKPIGKWDQDITGDYFITDNLDEIPFSKPIDYNLDFQFLYYKDADYESIHPFIVKYFSPSSEILDIISTMEGKYNLYDYSNICVLFYRGNDKITETRLCDYSEMIEKAKIRQAENPSLRFLIQSDETEFIEEMLSEFPHSFYFKDETRHMNKNSSGQLDLWDLGIYSSNYKYSKYFLAITIIMSKCKYVVCGSGNCSAWIMLYRNNAKNVDQYLNGLWLCN